LYKFGPEEKEITGDWRKLHNEELRNNQSSPNTVRVIKSRRMRRTGHAASMREEKFMQNVVRRT